MTPESQRVAIAEACGWRPVKQSWPSAPYERTAWVLDGVTQDIGVTHLPDYLSDLNAMHEALKSQSAEFRINFRAIIFTMANDTGVIVFDFGPDKWAEAFIRTLGLWIE